MTAPNDASRAQIAAARPDRSTWVAANAGSGKTRVLTDRVARLLLAGTDPQSILCLTYTKAAAAEMQTRLFDRLGGWAMLDNDALRTSLRELGETGALSKEALDQARTLFARALETPGGLKIQTIHAFCASLLRRFPLEAGVSPSFRELDERDMVELRVEVLDAMALEEPHLFDPIAEETAGADPEELIEAILGTRAAFAAPFDEAALNAALRVSADDDWPAVLTEALPAGHEALLEALLEPLRGSRDRDSAAGERFAVALSLEPRARLERLEGVLLYGEKAQAGPFAAKVGRFPTGPLRKTLPTDIVQSLDALMERVAAARPRRLALETRDRARALHAFAHRYLARFEAAKAARGVLDFEDQIERTRHLLTDASMAAWVLYKLDGGITHILVDEAQDTSPPQWQVIAAIAGEFFASQPDGSLRPRTVFAVGDPKQSIYSFQGAAPAAFGRMRGHFTQAVAALGTSLQTVDLLYSFRSATPILALVDEVLRPEGRAGLEAGETMAHRAFQAEMPGRVELWPYMSKPEKPEDTLWYEPVDTLPADAPPLVVAVQVSERVQGLLESGRLPDGKGGWRVVHPSDILILVRNRGPLFHAMIRAIKRAGLPVAGADRLALTQELAVRDVLAMLRTALAPSDDLSLAAVLRSPLYGLSEAELFALAHDRGAETLRNRLFAQDKYQSIREELEGLRTLVDFERPYELISHILVALGGRRKLVARLGAVAEDALDELLNQAIAYERGHAPSLGSFLHWLTSEEVDVKREADLDAPMIRVMTAHGAKGLEAPIVILPDTGPNRRDTRDERKVVLLEERVPVWKRGSATAQHAAVVAEIDAQKQRGREEVERLLYVALTRAEKHLIVFGGGERELTSKGAPSASYEACWYAKIAAAMAALGAQGEESGALVLSERWSPAGPTSEAISAAPVAALPSWVTGPIPPAPPRDRLLTPTGLAQGLPHALPGEVEDGAEALARGEAVHLLLDRLPTVPRETWAHATDQWLPDASSDDRAAWLAEASDMVAAPHLAHLFGLDTLAEVAIGAEIDGAPLMGRIDRLRVTPGLVEAFDFKTSRVVPQRLQEVPTGLRVQMAAYWEALCQVFPEHRVEVALVWTQNREIMVLPHDMLREARQSVPTS